MSEADGIDYGKCDKQHELNSVDFCLINDFVSFHFVYSMIFDYLTQINKQTFLPITLLYGEMDSNTPKLCRYIVYASKELGEYNDAKNNYSKALNTRLRTYREHHSDTVNYYLNIRWMNYEMNSYKEAKDDFNKGLNYLLYLD